MHKHGRLIIVNDKDYYNNVFIFGYMYGCERLMVFADHLEDAAEVMCDHVCDHAPGYECSEEVSEVYQEALDEGKSEDEAYNLSMECVWQGASGELVSSDVLFICENPGRKKLIEWKGE